MGCGVGWRASWVRGATVGGVTGEIEYVAGDATAPLGDGARIIAHVCNDAGGNTIFGASRPHNTLGYKDIDVQLSKDITFVGNLAGYVRVDVLNLFNWHNFNPGDIAVDSDTLRATYNKQGNIVGTPRLVKLTAGVRF